MPTVYADNGLPVATWLKTIGVTWPKHGNGGDIALNSPALLGGFDYDPTASTL